MIVDNMPQNFKLQKDNGIFIKGFYGDDNDDTALVDLATILQKIAEEQPEDIRIELAKHQDEIFEKVTSCFSKID